MISNLNYYKNKTTTSVLEKSFPYQPNDLINSKSDNSREFTKVSTDSSSNYNTSPIICDDQDIGGPNCPIYTGTLAVYRFSCAMALFFFTFMILTLGVSTSETTRARIHNG